jgi:hypothetical protein
MSSSGCLFLCTGSYASEGSRMEGVLLMVHVQINLIMRRLHAAKGARVGPRPANGAYGLSFCA